MTEQMAFLPAVSEEPHLTRDIHRVRSDIGFYYYYSIGCSVDFSSNLSV